MSKKTWLLIILVAATGVAVGFHYGFSPFTQFIQNPTGFLPKAWTFIQQHWQALVGAASGGFGTLVLAARAYGQHKQQTMQSLNALKQESSTTIMELQTKTQTLETQLSETTQTYSENFKTISENYVKVQDQLSQVSATNKQLVDERNYFARKVKELEAKLKEPIRIP